MVIDPASLRSAATTVAHSLAPVRTSAATSAAATTPPSTSKAAATGAVISSNDFLSLLVTEMKNQDPTQPTDPNAYIQQLVGVNSLQQLISINQDLTGALTSGTGAPVTTPAAPVSGS